MGVLDVCNETPNPDVARPPERYCILRPADPVAGMLTAVALESKTEELKSFEHNREKRIWRVRGVVSDHIPMIGDASTITAPSVFNRVLLNENPLTIYLHAGGRSAIYFDLLANSQRELEFVEVRVESNLPSTALLLARRPLNALLDVMTRNFNLPLCLQRLELLSPLDNSVLVYQVYLPQSNSIEAGPLGGIMQAPPFAPYDAIYREALVSSSPFYRLLCATRMYEGTTSIRKWLREKCVERNVQERLPPDPEISPERLLRFGFDPDFAKGIRKVQDLFHRLKDMRDAVAHFLIEREGSDLHVYLAEGAELEKYSTAAAALLYYAHLTLESCRSFYTHHIENLRGSVLPMVQNRDQFIVRASDFGLE
jgi:hypothetical protein